jgi:pyrroline-5-carboxylate reductase
MNKTIGFIGAGNMGSAMITGINKSEIVPSENILAYDRNTDKLETLAKEGITSCQNAIEVVDKSDFVVLAVKPNVYETVLKTIESAIDDQIIVSIAAGIDLAFIEGIIGTDKKIIRTMPNTPALVMEGMTAICPNENISDEQLTQLSTIFSAFGKTEIISEDMFHAFIGISGSSPAYVFKFIEAMADAAVKDGMKREKAYKIASQAVLGSAKLVLESNEHPASLKDKVCSPGGTTIEAVTELDKNGFNGIVIKAIEKCIDKSKNM